MIPDPNYPSSYSPSDNKGPTVLVTLWTLTSISIIVVGARLWSKSRITRRLYYDDLWMVIALLLGVAQAVTCTIAIPYGLGRHYELLSVHDSTIAIRRGISTIAWGISSVMFARVSFCVTMLFLTATDPHVPKWPIWVFIVLQLCTNMTQILVFYTQCGLHLDWLWTPSAHELALAHCLPIQLQTQLGYFVGSFNCLTDAFLTLLPAVLIQHTRLSAKRKLGLGLLLCLSFMALAAAIVKTWEAKELQAVTDVTYDYCFYIIWISIELNVVIIIASIPLLQPLFRNRRVHATEILPAQEHWDSMKLTSMFSQHSKGGVRANHGHLSLSSQENIVPPQDQQYYQTPCHGIQVTHEVEVTYEPSNAPFVHAALVGLIQGEIANPHLARR